MIEWNRICKEQKNYQSVWRELGSSVFGGEFEFKLFSATHSGSIGRLALPVLPYKFVVCFSICQVRMNKF